MFTFEDYQKAKVLKDLGYTIDTFQYNIKHYVCYIGAAVERKEPNEIIIAYKGEKPDLNQYIINNVYPVVTPYNLDIVFDNLFRNNLSD